MASGFPQLKPIPTEELFRREFEPVYRFLVGMLKDESAAEDATQETFRRALIAWDRYDERGQFRSWLFAIARREGLHAIRSRSRQPERCDTGLEDVPAATPWPDAVAVARDEQRVVRAAVNSLAPAEREVVLMRMDAGLPFKEIAAITGAPLSTVLNQMRRALAKLRQKLKPEVRDEMLT
jgi:RNA polymerase sigma-70 factor (ECF subfamily)